MCGLPSNPLSLSWLSGKPESFRIKETHVDRDQRTATSDIHQPHSMQASSTLHSSNNSSGLQRDSDYESITLMRLRQAEERKRLAQQLAQEEAD